MGFLVFTYSQQDGWRQGLWTSKCCEVHGFVCNEGIPHSAKLSGLRNLKAKVEGLPVQPGPCPKHRQSAASGI